MVEDKVMERKVIMYPTTKDLKSYLLGNIPNYKETILYRTLDIL